MVWYLYGKLLRDPLVGPSDLDRVVERAVKRVFRSMARVRDPERFPQFVSVVCRNVLASYHERRQPMAELPDLPAPAPASEIEGLDVPFVRRAVGRALDALPPAVAEVARRRLLDGESYTAIAEATGHPLATTRTYYSKALRRLREDPDLRAVYLGEAPAEADLAPPPADGAGEKEPGGGVRSRLP